jgi:ankyrin repeat protein
VLSVLYDDIFDNISRDPHNQSINKALDIVYHALRALTVVEFLDAISLCQGFVVADIMQLRTWTGDLIRVSTNASGLPRVQLFDDSLFKYLYQKKDVLFPQGHSALATACLQVLLAQEYPPELDPGEDDELPELDPANQEILRELDRVNAAKPLVRYATSKSPAANSLYGYATYSWGSHFRACAPSPLLSDLAQRYLEDDTSLNFGTMVAYALQPKDMAQGFDTDHGLSAAHVCSLFGLTNLLRHISWYELRKPAPSTGRTPLAYACGMGHIDTAMFLLKSGADPNSPVIGELSANARPVSALNLASTQGHLEIVKLLLEAGADINVQDRAAEIPGETPLMSASRLGHTEIARLLLECGADVNAKANPVKFLKETPLMSASRQGHGDIVKLLLNSGADLDSKSRVESIDSGSARAQTPLVCACKMGHVDTVKLLLQHGADINCKDADGESAIFHAVTGYSLEVTLLLIRYGADLAVKNRWGQSLLHRLVSPSEGVQELRLVGLLLENMPALIDTQDDMGQTSLHLALIFGQTAITKELLMRGADVNRLDKFGRAPFDVAFQYGRFDILPQLAPIGIYQIENLGQRASKNVNVRHFGSELLEVHLDKLPGWSLAYLGESLAVNIDLGTDVYRTIRQAP